MPVADDEVKIDVLQQFVFDAVKYSGRVVFADLRYGDSASLLTMQETVDGESSRTAARSFCVGDLDG